jgi:predicted small metal-binding protein
LSVLQFQHVTERPTHYSNRLSIKGVFIVSKVLYCNDLVPGCKFEAHGDSEEEILAAAADHIATAHNMTDISDEILAMVCGAIHEEVRTRTRAAGA